MFGFSEYYNGFMKGYQYVLYGSEKDNREEPIIDYGNLESIGYFDGYNQGIYCELTSQTKYVNHENLIAIIHKAYDRAIDTYREYEGKYIQYKSGFMYGKGEAKLKYKTEDDTFNVIPELDENDIDSISYYDGYCYALNRILNYDPELAKLEEEKQEKVPTDTIIRQCFKESYNNYPAFTNKSRSR